MCTAFTNLLSQTYTYIHPINQPKHGSNTLVDDTTQTHPQWMMRANERESERAPMIQPCDRLNVKIHKQSIQRPLRATIGYVRVSASSVSCGDETSAVSRHPLHSQSIDESRQVVSCVCFLAIERILSVFHIFYRIVSIPKRRRELHTAKKKAFSIRSDLKKLSNSRQLQQYAIGRNRE